MKRLIQVMVLLAGLSAVGVLVGLQGLDHWASTPREVPNGTIVELRPRLTLAKFSDLLSEKGLISEALFFHIWMRLDGSYPKLQAGNYEFGGPVSPLDIRDKIKRGQIYIPEELQIIVPEGFTLRLLIERLAAKGVGQVPELIALSKNRAFLNSLGIKANSLEGYTYPATYSFDKFPSGEIFFRKVVKTFFERIPDGYEARAATMGLTLDQAVTFASLIEMETMQESEKRLIAEVIWRRLKRGEPLGIDAAIIYGIPDYDGDIKWVHLRDAKNRYNTRIHKGLPPTPIGAVSRVSLEAVLEPTNFGYYYYVLDAVDHTHHTFSKTLAEHNLNVQKYLRASRQPTIQKSR